MDPYVRTRRRRTTTTIIIIVMLQRLRVSPCCNELSRPFKDLVAHIRSQEAVLSTPLIAFTFPTEPTIPSIQNDNRKCARVIHTFAHSRGCVLMKSCGRIATTTGVIFQNVKSEHKKFRLISGKHPLN